MPFGLDLSSLIYDKKKLFIVGGLSALTIIAVLIGIVLLGQSKAKDPVVQKPPGVDQPVTLNWWRPQFPNQGDDGYAQIIQNFRTLHSNVTINLATKSYQNPQEYYLDIIKQIGKGTGPDMFAIGSDYLPTMKDYLTYNRLFTGPELDNYKRDFVDLAVESSILQEHLYGVTTYVDNMQLYYNKDLLDEALISQPIVSWKDLDVQIPKLNNKQLSTSTFSQSAISLGTGGVRGNPAGFNIARHQDIVPLLILQNGGEIYDTVNNTVALDTSGSLSGSNNSPTLSALDFYLSFSDPTSTRYTWTNDSNNNEDDFINGKLVYIIHYSYFRDVIGTRNPRLESSYRVTDLPQFNKNKPKTFGFFFMDVLNSQLEKDKGKAVQRYWSEQFQYYLSQYDTQKAYATTSSLPSGNRKVINDQQQSDIVTRTFANGALYADNYFKPNVPKTEKLWSELIEKVRYNNISISEALQNMKQEYIALIQESKEQ